MTLGIGSKLLVGIGTLVNSSTGPREKYITCNTVIVKQTVRFYIRLSGPIAYGLSQPDLFLISISHISLSGATRRYLPGFIPPPERALATIRSHNVWNSGLASGRRNHRERASSKLA